MTTRRETPSGRGTPVRERNARKRPERSAGDERATRPNRSGPPVGGVQRRKSPAASSGQAKARAKARKAKAPKAVRAPLRDRLIARITSIEWDPRTLVTKVPFVVLVIGSLGIGLALTLWLSTDSAERSYELSNARERNKALAQQKESLERQVLEAQAAPALAESARNLGMIPSRDTAHLVQDASGNWVVVGDPKPAEGAPPAPLNTKLPDPTLAPPPVPVNRTEVPVLVPRPQQPAAAVPMAGPPPAPVANPEMVVRPPAALPAPPAALPAALPAPPAVVGEAIVPTGPLPGPVADAPPPANAPSPPAAPEQSLTVPLTVPAPTTAPPT
jgi:hypothetical protein